MCDELIKLIDKYETLYVEMQDLRAHAQEFDTKHEIFTYKSIAAAMEGRLATATDILKIR